MAFISKDVTVTSAEWTKINSDDEVAIVARSGGSKVYFRYGME